MKGKKCLRYYENLYVVIFKVVEANEVNGLKIRNLALLPLLHISFYNR